MLAADLIVRSALSGAAKLAKAALIADFPFLAVPPISWVFNFFFDRYCGKLEDHFGTEAGKLEIRVVKHADRKEYDEATEKLKEVVERPEGPSAEETEKARAEVERRLADLLRHNRG